MTIQSCINEIPMIGCFAILQQILRHAYQIVIKAFRIFVDGIYVINDPHVKLSACCNMFVYM